MNAFKIGNFKRGKRGEENIRNIDQLFGNKDFIKMTRDSEEKGEEDVPQNEKTKSSKIEDVILIDGKFIFD